jgi:hypothetical protein
MVELNKIYENILLEKTISITDNYWDNWFDEFYEEWLKDNSDSLTNFFETPQNFYYWKESLRDYLDESEKNYEEFYEWSDVDDDTDIEDILDTIDEEQMAEFYQNSLPFEQFIEKTYLKKQFEEDGIYDIYYYGRLEHFRNMVREQNGVISIYREMTVPANYEEHLLKQAKHIGIYWTWNSKGAEAYWGLSKHPNKALLKSSVKEYYIDWKTTLLTNCNLNLADEEEIRLIKGTPLKIEKIMMHKNYYTADKMEYKELDISKLKNKEFYA